MNIVKRAIAFFRVFVFKNQHHFLNNYEKNFGISALLSTFLVYQYYTNRHYVSKYSSKKRNKSNILPFH